MKKAVIVINGRGGAGKDTFCSAVASKYKVRNVSTIDPIKAVARQAGWDGGKDAASRAMLAKLKAVLTEYNDLPNSHAVDEFQRFLESDEEVMFVHIREPAEIAKFVRSVGGAARTLLIRRPGKESGWGNASDDGVEDYSYDYCYDNVKPLGEMRQDVLDFFEKIVE